MTRTAEIFGSSIVTLGSFNPAIFSPDWLEKNGLLGADDASVARQWPSMIVSHQVTVFETDWFAMQVLENQFALNSKGALSPAFMDLAASILTLVPHTPITAIGLNFMGHYRLASEAEYHKVGDVLAPKGIWDELYPDANDSAGLANLTIRIEHAPRGKQPQTGDKKHVSIQPSDKIRLGVFLSYNDHHEVRGNQANNQTSAERAVEIVTLGWEDSWNDAVRVFDGVISRALASAEGQAT